MCEPTEFKSTCVLDIKKVYDITKSASFYQLDNGDVEYISPITDIDKLVLIPGKHFLK